MTLFTAAALAAVTCSSKDKAAMDEEDHLVALKEVNWVHLGPRSLLCPRSFNTVGKSSDMRMRVR